MHKARFINLDIIMNLAHLSDNHSINCTLHTMREKTIFTPELVWYGVLRGCRNLYRHTYIVFFVIVRYIGIFSILPVVFLVRYYLF